MIDDLELLEPGTPIDLDTCDREAVHLAGAVQPHGILVTCEATPPHAILQRAADLSALSEGAAPATLAQLIGGDQATALTSLGERSGPPGLRPLRLARGGALLADVDAIAYRPREGLLAVELEPAGEAADGDAVAGDAAITALGALADAADVGDLLDRAVRALRAVTGHDRVWAYRFEPDGHGVVVAEDAIDGLESFLGLHYPASDIPAPARALFLRNAVRVIADVHATPIPVVPARDPQTGDWLDLSDSALRAVSPMHLAYLRQMGVRASMSVALRVDGALWGLLSAHHYAGPLRPAARVRARAELLGQVTSMQLRVLRDLGDSRERVALDEHASTLLERVAGADSIAAGLAAEPDALLGLCRADGALVVLGGEVVGVGQTPGDEDVPALLAALEPDLTDDGLVVRDDLAAGPHATGALGLSLSRRGDWLVWLRGPYEEDVTWAHRDKELVRRELGGEPALGPRESFERWAGEVAGRSRPWTAAERGAVAGFRQGLATFVIARAEELAALNAELERSNDELEAFAFAAAHDLQEPLRGIHNFTSFLVEDHGEQLGADGRELTNTILRLTERSTALLRALLGYARAGRDPIAPEPVALSSVVADLHQLLHARIAERGATIVLEAEATVLADPRQLEQALLNLVGNALKYGGDAPVVRVSARPAAEAEGAGTVVVVADDGIGIDPEHHETVFHIFRRLHPRDAYGGGSGAGLAIVARIAERHGGRVWVESAPGDGARFHLLLPGGS